jgi:hypothetical protein
MWIFWVDNLAGAARGVFRHPGSLAAEKRAEASSEAIWDVSTTRFLHKSLSLASPRTCFFRSLFKPLPDRPPWSVTFGRFGDHARVFLE